MGVSLQDHFNNLNKVLDGLGVKSYVAYNEITIEVKDQRDIHLVLKKLKKGYSFEQLTDVTAVDYLTYGQSDWQVGGSSPSCLIPRDILCFSLSNLITLTSIS